MAAHTVGTKIRYQPEGPLTLSPEAVGQLRRYLAYQDHEQTCTLRQLRLDTRKCSCDLGVVMALVGLQECSHCTRPHPGDVCPRCIRPL